MKNLSRLTALLLALVMLLSIPASATEGVSQDDLTRETWNEWVQDAENQAASTPRIITGGEVIDQETADLPADVPAYEITDSISLAQNAAGSETEQAVILYRYGKVVLDSGIADGQWQVLVGEQWINVSGETASSFEVTYAKVESLFAMNGYAKVRCISADGALVSDIANIGISYESRTLPLAEDELLSSYSMASTNDGIALAAEEGAEEAPETVIIEIAYEYQNGEAVATSFTAQIGKGDDLITSVISLPVIEGYVASSVTPTEGATFVAPSEGNSGTIQLNLQNVTSNLKYTVTYVPTFVDFTVEHYLMGFDGEQSTAVRQEEDTVVYSDKKTGEAVGSGLENTYAGYSALWYDNTTAVAADGSTVIKIYYERNWYLMLFDLDGGYGVEPIYAQYGADVEIGTPTKAGYVFKGWNPSVPATVPAGGGTYVAIWEVGDPVNYTVVYWKENADDAGYSFWGQETRTATAGTVISGTDDIPTSITTTTVDGNNVNERPYFTFNEARTDKNVVVKGDGSTVVNVYYYRNTYTIYFTGISGTCAIEEHTHGTNCNSYLDCLITEHVHGEDCERVLSCNQPVHEHVEDCSDLICEIPEHSEHTNACLICTKPVHEAHDGECCAIEEHAHSDVCCEYGVHTHTDACYICTEHSHSNECCENGGLSWTHWWHSNDCCNENLSEHTHGDGDCTYVDTEHAHGDGSCTCEQAEHTHGGSSCICDTEIHYHSEDQGCYSDVIHAHNTNTCYGLICGQAAHTHSDSCYTYTCGGEEHTHTDSCYRPCTKLTHTHNNYCNQNRDSNVIYVVTAKYEQTIGNVWPTAANFPNITFRGWSIDGQNNTAVSKRVNMTADLCDTGDKLKYAEAVTGGSKTYLYYMFESFDQTSPANGNDRILRNGVYYDKSDLYYQEVNSSGDWNQKEIYGMAPVSNGVVESGSNVFLYYTRNRSNLMFHNVNGVVKTVSSIMYEQPLKDYKDSDGNLLSAYAPPYPSTLEEGAYTFEGWYTTPECYVGTKFDFSTAIMPNGDLTLYANWVPVNRNVRVYPSEEDMDAGTNQIGDTIVVLHGSMVPEDKIPAEPENGNYTFVGWFYKVTVANDDGTTTVVEKAFDFNNMPVRRDLDIYAKWSSNTPVPFTIYYKLVNEDGSIPEDWKNATDVAAPLESQALDGTTITVEAKTGNDLYADYRTGYFPKPPSHSVEIDITKENNEYIFWYTPAQNVPYLVMYIEVDENGDPVYNADGTVKQLAESKLVDPNPNVVVTENYVRIPGYMPDAYQKRLIVTSPGTTEDNNNNETDAELGENIIFFYYHRDTVNAYWTVYHYIEPIGGVTEDTPWQEYSFENQTGVIGQPYTAIPRTIEGFSHDLEQATIELIDKNGVSTVRATILTETLPDGGMIFRLYYVRNEYPVKVQYLEQGTENILAPAELYNNGAKYDYQSQVSVSTAKTFNGYELVSTNPQVLQSVQVDGDTVDTVTKNVITFYYKKAEIEINYVGVAPDGTLITTDEQKETIGSVSPEAEPGTNGVVTALEGPVAGSTATAVGPTYKFVGWYLDEDCTWSVPTGWVTNGKITPQMEDTDGNTETTDDLLYKPATYYAKFDYDVGTLTIKKTGMADGESAIFTVTVAGKGTYTVVLNKDNGYSATLSGLPAQAQYEVEEQTGWTWSYSVTTPTNAEGSITAGADTEVEFVNSKSEQWLYDESSVTNFAD